MKSKIVLAFPCLLGIIPTAQSAQSRRVSLPIPPLAAAAAPTVVQLKSAGAHFAPAAATAQSASLTGVQALTAQAQEALQAQNVEGGERSIRAIYGEAPGRGNEASGAGEVVVLARGGWYSGLNEFLHWENFRKVREAALAAIQKGKNAGKKTLVLQINRTENEGDNVFLILNPQKDREAADGLLRFLNGISKQHNTVHIDSVSLWPRVPLHASRFKRSVLLPKRQGSYAGLNESLSWESFSQVKEGALAAIRRGKAAGWTQLILEIDRIQAEGYKEWLVLNPQDDARAASGLDRFLRAVSNQHNTVHLDSASLLLPRKR